MKADKQTPEVDADRGRKRKKRKFALLALLAAIVVGLPLVGAGVHAVLLGQEARLFPSTGERVEVEDSRSLHMLITGVGHDGPVIVLESGGGLTLGFWDEVQSLLSVTLTVVSYERAGVGWSDPPTHSTAIADYVEDLTAALKAKGLPGPYILAGHSIGGYYAREFARRRPELTAGLVLLDPTIEGWGKLPAELTGGVEGLQHQIGPWRVLAQLGVGRVWNPFAAAACSLPVQNRPDYVAATQKDNHLASTQRDGALMLSLKSVEDEGPREGDFPVRVISAGLGGGPAYRHLEEAQWAMHNAMAVRYTDSQHSVIKDANHISMLTESKHASVVADAILALARKARLGASR